MINKTTINEIDRIIKEIWVKEIVHDYEQDYLLREDCLKASLYYHLRKKLKKILKENNLRIYTEYYVKELGYFADIAIVELDINNNEKLLENRVKDIIAIFELKYVGGNVAETELVVKQDIQKIKEYIQIGNIKCQYYFTVIYETLCSRLNWVDKRTSNNWANGYLTELNAGYLDDGNMWFKVNSYNNMNKSFDKQNA